MSVDDLAKWINLKPYEFAHILKDFKDRGYVDFYRERFEENSIEDIRVVKLKVEGRRLAQGIFLAVNVLRDTTALANAIVSHKGGYSSDIGKLIPTKTEERALVVDAIKFIMSPRKYFFNEDEAVEYLRRSRL